MNRIFVGAQKLICSDGEVWFWKSESLMACATLPQLMMHKSI